MKTLTSLSLFFLSFGHSLRSEVLPAITLESKTVQAFGITSSLVELKRVADPVNATAHLSLDPTRTRSIASFFSGQIARDLVQPGKKVTEGQTLTILKSREVANALSRWLETNSRLASAKQIYEREQKLRPQQLTTEDELLTAQAAYEEARASQAAALQKALFARSREELEEIRQSDQLPDLTEITITSPIAGTIVSKSAHAGEPVEANSELFEIADLGSLLVEIQVPLRAASFLKPNDSVRFSSVIGELRTSASKVERLEPILDEQALTVRAFARLENPDGDWLVGTPVKVDLFDSSIPPVPAIPRTAVVSISGNPHVFLNQETNQFRPVAVVIGRESQTLAELTSNLPPNAKVVAHGANLLLAAWEELSNQ